MFGIFGVLLVAVRPSNESRTGWTEKGDVGGEERNTLLKEKGGAIVQQRPLGNLHLKDK